LGSAFRKLISISLATDYTFEQSKQFKEYLADPSKFASAAPVKASSSPQKGAAKKEEEKPKEKSEESEADMGFSLFD